MRNNRSGNIEYRDEEDVISIPTVVHIIYTDSIETNISDDQVYSAIQALNDDFRKRVGTQGYGNGVDKDIFITPNPVADILFVNHQDYNDNSLNVEIIDQYGRLMLSKTLQSNVGRTKIDVSNIKSGIYFVRYIQNNKLIETEKIVIVD